MPTTTGLAIVTNAFDILGVYDIGNPIAAADANGALTRLNLLMSTLRLEPLLAPVVTREVFPLTADKGGPDNPYTIGPGGDFNTTRPATVSEITGWSLLLGSTSTTSPTTVELPRAMLTDDMFQALQLKGLGNSLFTDAYYNPTYGGGLGTIILWPVPNTTVNGLVLYRLLPIALFTSLAASIDLPDGYEDMLGYQLARRLLTPYGIADDAIISDVRDLAGSTLAAIKRANTRMMDLPTDPALTNNRRAGYNIDTGNG